MTEVHAWGMNQVWDKKKSCQNYLQVETHQQVAFCQFFLPYLLPPCPVSLSGEVYLAPVTWFMQHLWPWQSLSVPTTMTNGRIQFTLEKKLDIAYFVCLSQKTDPFSVKQDIKRFKSVYSRPSTLYLSEKINMNKTHSLTLVGLLTNKQMVI